MNVSKPDASTSGAEAANANLGFLGAGLIGTPMAERLLRSAGSLLVAARANAGTERLRAAGARVCATPREMADEASLIFACLPSNKVFEDVMLGPQGVVGGTAVRTVVNLGTSGAEFAVAMAGRLADAGIDLLDAPVTGGVPGARDGTLTVMVSGPMPAFEDVLPLLRSFAGKVTFVAERPGAAQTLKVVNNLLSATAFAVTTEALLMGAKAGLDPHVMLDVINAGSGRNSATADKFPRTVLRGTLAVGASTATICKDLALFVSEAEACGTPAWIANVVRQYFLFSASRGEPGQDLALLVRHLETLAGVRLGPSGEPASAAPPPAE